MMTSTVPMDNTTDQELVAQSLAGDRHAFGQIVARYQTLVCSVAYSATGSLSQSEDLSQETFLTAWKHLADLREPGKLRSWLCGIVRNLCLRTHRRQQHEPTHAAEPLDAAAETTTAADSHPLAQTIGREEEALLWRALESLPETYREPLILFYREQQSLDRVAQALELSEDATRQRLSRGRKLLQDEIATFVESALRRTAPDQKFSSAVLAALPLATGSAASVGAGAGAKGAATAKTGFLATSLALLTPFLGIVAGVFAQCLMIRAATPDPRQRARLMAQAILFWVIVIGLAWGGEAAVQTLGQHYGWSSQTKFVSRSVFWWAYCCGLITAMSLMARSNLAFGKSIQAASAASHTSATPMNPFMLATVIVGIHLALFFALIRVAWNNGDQMGAALIATTAAILSLVAFVRVRGKTGAAIAPVAYTHLGICCAALLLALNLRIDVWVANAYNVTVPEAWHLQPLWLIPLLSVALLLWVRLMSMLTKRSPGAKTK